MKFWLLLLAALILIDSHICNAAAPALPGDYNADGSVDEADYVDWRVNIGMVEAYDVWRANFGSTAAITAADGTPAVQVVQGGTQANGHLNTAGNWVWKVQIAPSNPIPTGSTALNAAIGFREDGTNAQLLSAANLSTSMGDDFDTSNPSIPIFGWETYSDTNGDAVIDSTVPTDDEPVGLQVNAAAGQVFTALGSQVYSTTGFKDYISIESLGPCVDDGSPGSSCTSGDRLSTTIALVGAYGGKGRISELNAAFDGDGTPASSLNYDLYAGATTRTAIPGDANLDGVVTSTDYSIWLANAGGSNTGWQHGDFNDDDLVNAADLQHIRAAGVPEPTSALLLVIGGALLGGRVKRSAC
jgi:hypothetical protein